MTNELDPTLRAALDNVAASMDRATQAYTAVQATNVDTAAALREFATAMGRVHADAEALADEMVRYRQAFEAVDRRTWRAALAGAFAVLILAVAVTVSVVTSRRNAEIVETIRDCTQAGGRCYQEGQQRTAANVQQLVDVICDAVPAERRRPPCPAQPPSGTTTTTTTGG